MPCCACVSETELLVALPVDLSLEFFALIGPTYLLASQPVNQGRRSQHLSLAALGVIEQQLFLGHGCVVHILNFAKFGFFLVEGRLSLVQLSLGAVQTGLLDGQVCLEPPHSARLKNRSNWPTWWAEKTTTSPRSDMRQ